MARGNQELSRCADVALLVLISLAEGQKHGYRMIGDIEEFSGTSLEPGTLYGKLMRLAEDGLIEAVQSVERHRPYRITEAGRDALREQLDLLRRIERAGVDRVALKPA
ncbi:DNA-binding PadR family transcriptional regulator [Nonomuraea fuscirosea]|uniref:DNA-binding PadR family transcriptional regulator n=1 Tax=Nonomuraea fuscirosea TaxID=1291556 RepID=A0A2T0N962_9ACTN|nr:PadR family transcriptional regulator [Nonomuraea fuscirosea]PRX69328.1 DNA-binding PadR family transcriptional regulator [Nonomuraea fuscirosea]